MRTTHTEQRAEQDITCYKVVLVDEKSGKWKGYHGYNDRKFAFDTVLSNNEKRNVYHIADGQYEVHGGFFHSADYIGALHCQIYGQYENPNARIVRCTIPKGAKYFQSQNGYASRKIIVHSGGKGDMQPQRF